MRVLAEVSTNGIPYCLATSRACSMSTARIGRSHLLPTTAEKNFSGSKTNTQEHWQRLLLTNHGHLLGILDSLDLLSIHADVFERLGVVDRKHQQEALTRPHVLISHGTAE